MWFRNLQIYRLPAAWAMSADSLIEQLQRGLAHEPASHEAAARGWAPVRDDAILYQLNGQWMIRLQVAERILPTAVINRETRKRANAIEAQQGYAPARTQMREIRERVVEELLPKSHIRERNTFVWIDPQAGWFVVDAGSQRKAEEVIEHLRHCLDDFPLKPFHTQNSPQTAMADWLASGDAPSGFTVDRDCQLKAVGEEKATVAWKSCPLENDEIKGHLAGGKRPTRLALTWDDRMSFVLTEKLEIKRIHFLDLLKEEAEQKAEHADEQFDADFALMTGELRRFLVALTSALGGEVCDA